MKKRIIFLVLIFISCLSVQAKEPELTFIKDKEHIYYESFRVKEEDFSSTIEFAKESSLSTTFSLVNNCGENLSLYLLLDSKAQDGSYNDLLDYMSLKVTLNNKVVYEDSAKILNQSSKELDLHDYIPIGELTDSEPQKLLIEMTVLDDYKAVSKNQFAYINYSFHYLDKTQEYIEIEPFTSDMYYNLSVFVFLGIFFGIIFFILLLYFIHKRKEYRRIHGSKKREE